MLSHQWSANWRANLLVRGGLYPVGGRNEVSYEVSPLDHMPNQSMINLRPRPVPPISR
jgi:hypothetical protein